MTVDEIMKLVRKLRDSSYLAGMAFDENDESLESPQNSCDLDEETISTAIQALVKESEELKAAFLMEGHDDGFGRCLHCDQFECLPDCIVKKYEATQ